MSLKFISKGPIDIIPALVQIMAWGRTDDKPLCEPILTQYTKIYATLGLNVLSWSLTGSVILN